MGTYTVAKKNQIGELDPLIVDVKGSKVAIYQFKGRYYAYENVCAHEGGPVAEGLTVGDVECKVSPEGKLMDEYFSKENMDIVCPWHGVQYDLQTGVCRADGRLKLVSYEVIVDGDDVRIII